jgi:5-methylcytosine-specific restriction endonuclease McrA
MQTKLCITCNLIKTAIEFNKNKSCKDGLTSYCKSCEKERAKKYKEGFRIATINRLCVVCKKTSLSFHTKTVCSKCYYMLNREKSIQTSRKNRLLKKEEYARVKAIWREKNKEKEYKRQLEYSKSPHGIFIHLRKKANERKIFFNLTEDFFIFWWGKNNHNCSYCKRTLTQILATEENDIKRFTIDRIDNSLGYLPTNLAIACYTCNTIKGDFFNSIDMLEIGKIVKKKSDNILIQKGLANLVDK